MKKCIVTTTINAPTEAIRLYDRMDGWELIVVGDKKTPAGYELERGLYLSPERQKMLPYRCVDVIPWGKIQRRNIGFLYALAIGADVIATIDDDNIPYENWSELSDISSCRITVPEGVLRSSLPYERPYRIVDPLSYVSSDTDIWHRGYPVQLLWARDHVTVDRYSSCVDTGVQAGLWDGEPDVDAICRIANGPFNLDLEFRGYEKQICIAHDTYAPFNTQNTAMQSCVAAVMGLPYSIGRMDDIWAGYVAQKIMRHVDLSLVYTRPTVRQERNEHDLSRDLEAELIGYRHTDAFLTALEGIDLSRYPTDASRQNMLGMYEHVTSRLSSLEFLDDEYKRFTEAWVDDISRL